MTQLHTMPQGTFEFELETSSSCTPTLLDSSSDVTVPGSPEICDVQTLSDGSSIHMISSTSSSSSSLEVLAMRWHLWPEEETRRMQNEERHGHYFRVLDRQRALQLRLSTVSQSVSNELSEARQTRKRAFQRQVFNTEL